jgi:DNA-directed RNA polymerase beta' subunit
MACEEIKKTLATIFVSEFNVTTKFSLEIYRSLIYRNLRLTKQYELNAPELIKINEQRLIQELVDELF